MTEYIERDAISEEIRKYYYKNPPNFSYGEGFDRGLDRAQRAILDTPAADVAQVRHGRWEWDTEDIYRCSNCAEKSHVKEVMGIQNGTTAPTAARRWTEVAAIAIWHEQEHL